MYKPKYVDSVWIVDGPNVEDLKDIVDNEKPLSFKFKDGNQMKDQRVQTVTVNIRTITRNKDPKHWELEGNVLSINKKSAKAVRRGFRAYYRMESSDGKPEKGGSMDFETPLEKMSG